MLILIAICVQTWGVARWTMLYASRSYTSVYELRYLRVIFECEQIVRVAIVQ